MAPLTALSYNLLSEPWIPCARNDGAQQEVGLADLFRRARELRDLEEPNPLVRIALYRLLLGILYRTQRIETQSDCISLWKNGWDERAILAYLDKWQNHFDLFSASTPFLQRVDLDVGGKTTPVTKLGHEFAAGNNKQLFDHSADSNPPALSPAEAARLLIGCQAWAIGGGISGGGRPRFTSASLPRGACVVALGETLAETLLLNLVPRLSLTTTPRQFTLEEPDAPDRPAWERASDPPADERFPDGPADYLTWQTRYVRLLPEEDGTVRWMAFAQGEKLLAGDPEAPSIDPLHAVVESSQKRRIPKALSPHRAVWRDADSLFAHMDATTASTALALNGLANVRARDSRLLPRALPVLVAGIAVPGGQPPPDLWCAQVFQVPLRVLHEPEASQRLVEALRLAQDVARLLRRAIYIYANSFLEMSTGPGDPKAIAALTDALCREEHYWAALEVPFQAYLPTLAQDDPSDAPWRRAVHKAAEEAFEASLASQDATGRHWKAQSAARSAFHSRKDGLNSLIPKEEASHDAEPARR